MKQKLIFTDSPAQALSELVQELAPKGKVFILADNVTAELCFPLVSSCAVLADTCRITLPAGDGAKNLESLSAVWEAMTTNGGTRHSLLINLGGGMVTDLGGFAAATFKRGIDFINIPTTLLSAVDAAVGGKTGINFLGLKNEIGAFAPAVGVIVSAAFYATLPQVELLSGYGELLKHALIDSPDALAKALQFDILTADPTLLLPLVEESVAVKERIVAEDPFEHGLRRALNLGHTSAHALESLAMRRNTPVPHGVAVAYGLVIDLVLSHLLLGFPSSLLHDVAGYVKRNYPAPVIDCKDYPELIDLMRHDKKNIVAASIDFTLLHAPGKVALDCIVPPSEITAAIDIARDLLGV